MNPYADQAAKMAERGEEMLTAWRDTTERALRRGERKWPHSTKIALGYLADAYDAARLKDQS